MNSITNLTPAQLRKAASIQEKIQKLHKKLNQLLGGQASPVAKTAEAPKARRKFSAATRAKMKAAQKARWAKVKKAGKAKL